MCVYVHAKFEVSISLQQNKAQNQLKMIYFKFCEKSVHETVLTFCMKLQQYKGFKLTEIIFFVKILCERNGPRMRFFRFYGEWKHDMFLFFV